MGAQDPDAREESLEAKTEENRQKLDAMENAPLAEDMKSFGTFKHYKKNAEKSALKFTVKMLERQLERIEHEFYCFNKSKFDPIKFATF
jgi:hypothetical protein